MKISDARLQLLINMYQKIDSTDPVHTDAIAAFRELQELRAAQHERRWRKISDEGLPMEYQSIQFTDGKKVLYFDRWIVKDNFGVVEHSTHWRPQDTDLPEIDIDS